VNDVDPVSGSIDSLGLDFMLGREAGIDVVKEQWRLSAATRALFEAAEKNPPPRVISTRIGKDDNGNWSSLTLPQILLDIAPRLAEINRPMGPFSTREDAMDALHWRMGAALAWLAALVLETRE